MTEELELLQRLHEAPELQEAVQGCNGQDLSVQQRLRQIWDADLVRAALTLDQTRHKAAAMFPQADQLWLTPTGLEQCTDPLVAAHKAQRFPDAQPVLDLCCGIGSDAAALSRRGPVVAVDLDECMLQRCRWNLQQWHPEAEVEFRCGQATDWSLAEQLLHVDPDRRNGRPRPTKRLEQYSPDLAWMQQATQQAAGGAIKIGPASNFIQKFPGCEIELISLHGECREATVWFGSLADGEQYRATVLPTGETIAGDPLDAWAPQADAPLQYLFDPDPAVVRSGLLDGVCEQLDLQRLDPEEEYLTGDTAPDSGFVTGFEVEAVLPNNERQLRQHLRSSPAARYEVKCRRVPINANAVAKKLPKSGDGVKVVFFLRVQGKARIVVARRLPSAS